MSDLWVIVSSEDVRIQMPLSMDDRDVKIMFRNVETIDSVITQLESLRETIGNSVEHFA